MIKKIMAVVLLVIIAMLMAVFIKEFSGIEKNTSKIRFIIRQGASEAEIIGQLRDGGFLKNKGIFSLILTIKGWHGKIEPGGYQLSKSLNAYQLAKSLISGPSQKWVLVPPGKRKEQTALILQKALSWPDDMIRSFILVAEEGYLYPDTYLINIDADSQEIYRKMLANFNEKYNEELQKDLLSQNIRNDTALKIASLIERESGGDEDKPIIAGIIWNRLSKGMKLEIDATVQYAVASEKLIANSEELWNDFNFWEFLPAGTVRKIDSPYNTYLIKGLPPGPICSPSIESLRAVATPVETDALYYLHSPDKIIHTARTFKEHQENIEKYLSNP